MDASAKGRPSIRIAGARDSEAIARLFRFVRTECLPFLPTLHTPEEDAEYFSGLVSASAVFVAGLRGEVVAFVAHRDGWLEHLYVHPLHQRRSIGGALLARAMESNGELMLWVFQRNVAAIAFYERAGFRLVRVTDGLANEEREPDALYTWQRPAHHENGRK
ncbi:MAG TPA: GNAT family N-acetyltransferase [Candidatus Cybelea sp.]|jgi:ribosomal protein S18 acetylase RimI-like enzyme|nr:GNAT family N-acetyltransferase [Candidatus Cybelea sp.]